MTVLKASDYPKYKPIPRLHREVVFTEKINGSNGLIHITKVDADYDVINTPVERGVSNVSIWDEETQTHTRYQVRVGSRNRWLTVDSDNFGFAKWVHANAVELAEGLREGYHYGEWFGLGIQVGYGLDEKRFALFNTAKWYDPRNPDVNDQYLEFFSKAKPAPACVTVVPVLAVVDGHYINAATQTLLHTLESTGSVIAPGFMKPEGIVAFHTAGGVLLKATIHDDEKPKSQVKKSK